MAHVATITIDHTKVPGDLTDYVGLIVPDGSAGYSALYALCLEGGGDIRLFKSDDTTELAREIVSFSVSAETGEIHYRYAGTLSSSVDTDIHVYADGSSADYAVGATYGRNAVWSDYEFVSHLIGTTDSAGNHNLTANGGVTLGGAGGQIGDGTDFDGSNDSATHTGTTLGAKGAFAVQFWCNPDTVSTRQGLVRNDNGASFAGSAFGVELRNTTNGVLSFQISTTSASSGYTQLNSSASMTTGAWQKVTATRNSNVASIYRNAVSIGTTSAASTANTNNLANFGIGAFGIGAFLYFNGRMDEVRIPNFNITANWETTEYNNQNSPSTFYSVAAVAGGSAAQAARRGAVMMM